MNIELTHKESNVLEDCLVAAMRECDDIVAKFESKTKDYSKQINHQREYRKHLLSIYLKIVDDPLKQ